MCRTPKRVAVTRDDSEGVGEEKEEEEEEEDDDDGAETSSLVRLNTDDAVANGLVHPMELVTAREEEPAAAVDAADTAEAEEKGVGDDDETICWFWGCKVEAEEEEDKEEEEAEG